MHDLPIAAVGCIQAKAGTRSPHAKTHGPRGGTKRAACCLCARSSYSRIQDKERRAHHLAHDTWPLVYVMRRPLRRAQEILPATGGCWSHHHKVQVLRLSPCGLMACWRVANTRSVARTALVADTTMHSRSYLSLGTSAAAALTNRHPGFRVCPRHLHTARRMSWAASASKRSDMEPRQDCSSGVVAVGTNQDVDGDDSSLILSSNQVGQYVVEMTLVKARRGNREKRKETIIETKVPGYVLNFAWSNGTGLVCAWRPLGEPRL